MARNRRKRKGNDKDEEAWDQNPTANFIFTALYFLEVIFCFWLFSRPNERNNTESTSTDDLGYFLGFVILTAIAVKITEWMCHNVATKLSTKILGEAPFNDPLSKTKTLDKFTGTVWQFVIHVTMASFELYCLLDQPWWDQPFHVWVPLPWTWVITDRIRLLYIAQIAIWVYTCYSHRFDSAAHMHSDYFVMYAHHIVTIGLVGLSYWQGYTRIGLMVLFLHDLSDIPVDILKMTNYLKLEGPRCLFCVEIAFVANLCSWLYLRMYRFPLTVIYAGAFGAWMPGWGDEGNLNLYDATKALVEAGELTQAQADSEMLATKICTFLLCILQCMHVWWFFLFLRILWGIINDGAHEAGRNEYEGASTDPEHDKDK